MVPKCPPCLPNIPQTCPMSCPVLSTPNMRREARKPKRGGSVCSKMPLLPRAVGNSAAFAARAEAACREMLLFSVCTLKCLAVNQGNVALPLWRKTSPPVAAAQQACSSVVSRSSQVRAVSPPPPRRRAHVLRPPQRCPMSRQCAPEPYVQRQHYIQKGVFTEQEMPLKIQRRDHVKHQPATST